MAEGEALTLQGNALPVRGSVARWLAGTDRRGSTRGLLSFRVVSSSSQRRATYPAKCSVLGLRIP